MPPALRDAPPVRPHPSQPPRCRPSLSFPALPPRRCATSIRRFVPALLIPYACCALVASVIAAPSRPSPHRTDSIATTEPTEAYQRQPTAPPPGRARPEKASRHPSAPPDSVAGHRPKKACHLRVKSAFRPRRQKQGPLRGGFHWGEPQAPVIMPKLEKARSSSSGSAAPRGRYTLIRPAPPRVHWGLAAPKPQPKGI